MEYYTYYEVDGAQYADGYASEKIAKEYAEEAEADGYENVRVLREDELLLIGGFSTY